MSSSPIARSAGPVPASLPSSGSRLNALRYRAKVALNGPTTFIGLLLAGLFTYLIVMPVLSILFDAVRVQFPGTAPSVVPYGLGDIGPGSGAMSSYGRNLAIPSIGMG